VTLPPGFVRGIVISPFPFFPVLMD